jgi:hypothetical protein
MRGRRVLLADDVRNTGKTFERCAALVREAGRHRGGDGRDLRPHGGGRRCRRAELLARRVRRARRTTRPTPARCAGPASRSRRSERLSRPARSADPQARSRFAPYLDASGRSTRVGGAADPVHVRAALRRSGRPRDRGLLRGRARLRPRRRASTSIGALLDGSWALARPTRAAFRRPRRRAALRRSCTAGPRRRPRRAAARAAPGARSGVGQPRGGLPRRGTPRGAETSGRRSTAFSAPRQASTSERAAGGGRNAAGVDYFFPSAVGGSACKRLNLFLRWMVRRDASTRRLDAVSPASQLVVPLDTHVVRVGKLPALTRYNTGWKMAADITPGLGHGHVGMRSPARCATQRAVLAPDDPVGYDFALYRATWGCSASAAPCGDAQRGGNTAEDATDCPLKRSRGRAGHARVRVDVERLLDHPLDGEPRLDAGAAGRGHAASRGGAPSAHLFVA